MNVMSTAIEVTNGIPGNRILFYTVTSFMTTFDRLQLYYFHHHNTSHYSTMLLSNVNAILEDRGKMPQKLLRDCDVSLCKSIVKFYDDLEEGLERKK